jgi:hydroxypyruvate reductase
LPERIAVREASHPIPDERGVQATREILDLVSTAGEGDLVIALISGGGSALMEAPKPPVTLADIARTTDLLLKAGAPIQDLNAVRIPLSLVKGGGLRRAASDAEFISLILSDVLGNDTQFIASGPTVFGEASGARALALIDRYQVRNRVPAVVIDVLESTLSRTDRALFADDRVVMVADNAAAVAAVRDAAEGDGCSVRIHWTGKEGEASDLGTSWVKACRDAPVETDVLLGGGEATVTVRGDGVGGRNTEFSLAAAIAMERTGLTGWTIASVATDGQDGPTGVAGAIADAETCARARAASVDPVRALAENDSLAVFQVAGGVVDPGPTGTNVNDLYIAVRDRRSSLL